MREREQELSARNEYFCQMCRKRDANVEFFCTACPRGQICQGCYSRHKRIPALKFHQIHPLEKKITIYKNNDKCTDHGELLEFFCASCEKAICVTCTCHPEHEEHCDQIVDLKTGLKELKVFMNKLCQKFKENTTKVEGCAEMLTKDTDSIKECKDALSTKCEEVETILNQMKEQLQVITQLYQLLRNSREEINTHFADVKKQMTEINNLQGFDIDFIQNLKECRRNCDRVMNDTEMILNRKITIPENMKQNIEIVGDVGQVKTIEVSLKEKLMAKTKSEVAPREKSQIKPDTQVLRPSQRQTDKYNELNDPQLLLEIKPGRTVDIRNILEVVSVGDGTVILVDKELNYIQRINTEGQVVRKYQVDLTLKEQVHYASACIYGDYLFVLTSDDIISRISLMVLVVLLYIKLRHIEQ